MSCEKCCLRHQRCENILLSTRIGMKKSNKTFLIEKGDVHVKCSKTEMKKMSMTNKNDLVIEMIWRFYNANHLIKKCKSWTIAKCKDWLIDNPVTDLLDMEFLLQEEVIFSEITKQSNNERNKVQ